MSEVISITSKQKKESTDSVFKKSMRSCYHGVFIIDESLNKVTCGKCNEGLNPMWVLKELAQKESYNRHRLMDVQRELKQTEAKMHCKCDKCGKMTRIAR